MLTLVSIFALLNSTIIGVFAVKKKRWGLIFLQLPIALVAIIAMKGEVQSVMNPYKKMGITFLKDNPGATGRYVTYTPVLSSDMKTAVGPTIGADNGVLSFRNLDQDRWREVIVETKFRFTVEGDYYRAVLKFMPDSEAGAQRFIEMEEWMGY